MRIFIPTPLAQGWGEWSHLFWYGGETPFYVVGKDGTVIASCYTLGRLHKHLTMGWLREAPTSSHHHHTP